MRSVKKTLEQLNLRLKGYDRHFKGRFLLLQKGFLTQGEYVLWDLGWSVLADWDKGHPEIYGTFGHTWEEIGLMLGCSASKVSRDSNTLFGKGLWGKTPGGRVKVCGFEISKSLAAMTEEDGIVDIQKYLAETKTGSAETQRGSADTHENLSKGDLVGDKRLRQKEDIRVADMQAVGAKDALRVPYKDEYKVLRSEGEYQRIVEAGGY